MNPVKKMMAGLALAAALFLNGGGAASAAPATATANITLNAGTLTVTTFANPSINMNFGSGNVLTGANQTASSASQPTFQIINATGSTAGWSLTLQAQPFAMTATGTQPVMLVSSGAVTVDAGQNVNIVTQSGVDISSAVKVVTTNTGTTGEAGRGQYKYTPGQFQVAVPADAIAGSYTSTITATITNTP